MIPRRLCVFFLLCPVVFWAAGTERPADHRPNIVLILADDMGYSDLGSFGSEIPTPNLDSLAARGLRLNQFYNTARCSPTRAALLTGLHPHEAGMGRLAEEAFGLQKQGQPGYLGYLNDHCLTLAEVLHDAGYHTYLAGKWHLGMRDRAKWPLQRGFDRFYGILTGATNYFQPSGVRGLTLDNQQLPTPTDPNYYTTDAFTDFAIKQVRETGAGEPFFLYLAFNAPHWPLNAPQADIDRFVGKYRMGWDRLREQRHAKQIELGVVKKEWPLSPRDPGARAWDELTEKEKTDLDYRMAVYAAQVNRLDWNVGRLVTVLRERGELDKTLIVFLSDNGACAEPYSDLGGREQAMVNDRTATGAISYGQGWANASNTPFRRFKSMLHEGGIAAPFIVHWPAGLKVQPGTINATPSYITDLMPTFIDVAGAAYPHQRNGQAITPLAGRSLLPLFAGASLPPRVMFWEQYGFKAVREGNLKAVFSVKVAYDHHGRGQWELYDLAQDRSELHDLAAARPDDLARLERLWETWAKGAQVLPSPVTAGAKRQPVEP